jgi:hypothetical protein
MYTHQQLANLLAKRAELDVQIDALQRQQASIDREIIEVQQYVTQMSLPCWECKHPVAEEVRHLYRTNYDPNRITSLSGLPMNCCRITEGPSFSTNQAINGPVHRQL